MRDWPLLLAAATLLLMGSGRAAAVGTMDALAAALLAAGLVLTGVWVRDHYEDDE